MNTAMASLQRLRDLLLALLVATTPLVAVAETVHPDTQEPTLNGRLTRASAWPGGDTVLLLHGTLAHRDMEIIRTLETLLADYGVSTLAINLSLGVDDRDSPFDCGAVHRHREGDATAELARWSDWLARQGVTGLTLLGHSRGANQAARYVLDSGDARVRHLVLVAPPRWSAARAAAAYTARHGRALAPLLTQARTRVASGQGDARLPGPVGLLYCEDATVTAASFLSYYRDDPLRDTPTLLAELDLPVLVIAGSEDPIATGLPAALAGAAANVRVEEIEGADHFFRDLYADELVEIAVEFMHGD
jgi:pimeloyl-ACP methyl ester carboxylesterase